MNVYGFDDRSIHWHQLGELEYFSYDVLDVDEQNNIVDVIFKFEPNKQIVLHRHKALNKTFVVQGEHRFYEANGHLKEVCRVGSLTSRPASNDPHRECGGDEGAVVLFSIRGNESGRDEALYELLDEKQNVIGILSMQDFIDLYQTNNGSTAKETVSSQSGSRGHL